jgi:hypothetical protein
MGIGTSQGAYYDDSFHKAAAEWDPKYDTNEIGVDQDNPALNDKNNVLPQDVQAYRSLPNQMQEQIGMKSQMPFPDNNNPNTDFTNRFGNLPPSGVLNDLKKPSDPSPPLIRKIAYLGNLTNTPDEVMTGVEMSHSYPQGYGSAGPTQKPEKIKSAALMHGDELYEDINHGMALNRILDSYPNAGMKDTTTHGRFISREEAMGIAQSQRQINHPDIPNYGMLLSEDLK